MIEAKRKEGEKGEVLNFSAEMSIAATISHGLAVAAGLLALVLSSLNKKTDFELTW